VLSALKSVKRKRKPQGGKPKPRRPIVSSFLYHIQKSLVEGKEKRGRTSTRDGRGVRKKRKEGELIDIEGKKIKRAIRRGERKGGVDFERSTSSAGTELCPKT